MAKGHLIGIPSFLKNKIDSVINRVSKSEHDYNNHNTNTESHNDIRLLITDLANRLNALADSDDETLDQMSELVTYIKSNKALIESVTTSKINVTDIIDNLTTNVNDKVLAASQGVAIKTLITALETSLNSHISNSDIHFTSTERTKLSGIASGANKYTHPTSGVTAGTYKSVKVNANGHVTGGTNPTTLSGYGITDAESKGSVSTHNSSTTAHSDIRQSIADIETGVNQLNSDIGSNYNLLTYTYPQILGLTEQNATVPNIVSRLINGSMYQHRLFNLYYNDSNLSSQLDSDNGFVTIKRTHEGEIEIQITTYGENGKIYYYSSNLDDILQNKFTYHEVVTINNYKVITDNTEFWDFITNIPKRGIYSFSAENLLFGGVPLSTKISSLSKYAIVEIDANRSTQWGIRLKSFYATTILSSQFNYNDSSKIIILKVDSSGNSQITINK
jgi:hypothetical protein